MSYRSQPVTDDLKSSSASFYEDHEAQRDLVPPTIILFFPSCNNAGISEGVYVASP